MRIPIAFSPIEVGETDNFAFDYTADIGAASMVSSAWTCTFDAGQIATDPSPQDRVLSTTVLTQIQVRSPVDGSVVTKNGFFSVAQIGGFPTSAQGGTYVLESLLTLSDGRVLALNSTVTCVAPGQ